MKETDSELQERMLDMGIMQQVRATFESLSGKKDKEGCESYKFIILDFSKEDGRMGDKT